MWTMVIGETLGITGGGSLGNFPQNNDQDNFYKGPQMTWKLPVFNLQDKLILRATSFNYVIVELFGLYTDNNLWELEKFPPKDNNYNLVFHKI